MGCKKATIRVGKVILQAVSPPGVRFITEMVQLLQETEWANDDRRRVAVELGRARLRQLGRDVEAEGTEAAIRATVEVAVMALKKAADQLDQLGQDPDAEGPEPV